MSVVAVSVSGMSQLTSRLRHPVVACVAGLEELLDGGADLDPGYLRTGDKADVLVRLTGLVDRVEGLRLRVMASAMDVADVEGAPTVAAWLAPRTLATTRSLHRQEQLARGLDRRWQHVGAGVASGSVSLAQAEVIVRALDAPDALDALDAFDAPVWVSGWTGSCSKRPSSTWSRRPQEFTPPALRTLGERILEVICPERYDDQERQVLLAAEHRASAATRLSLQVRGDGSVDLRARIPEATAPPGCCCVRGTTTVVGTPPCRGSRSGSNASSRAQKAWPRRWSAGTRAPSAWSTSPRRGAVTASR